MRRGILAVLLFLLASGRTEAQTATDPNEGLTIAPATVSGGFELSWWAKAGRTYFIQQSGDLLNWNFLDVMETASPPGIIMYGVTSSADRSFWRLRYTDVSFFSWEQSQALIAEGQTSGPPPNTLTSSGSGLTLLQCYQNGYSPYDYYAGKAPILNIISGNNQYGAPGWQLPSPLVVEVRDQNVLDSSNNPILLVGAPVVFLTTSNDNGYAYPNYVTTGPDGRVTTYFTTSTTTAAVSTVTAYAAAATNEAGKAFTEGNVPPPNPPGGVNVVQNADGSIDMTWVYPADNTTTFDIQVRGAFGEWVTLPVSAPANTTSVHINPDHQTFQAFQ